MKKTIAIILSAILIIAAVALTSFALEANADGWYEISTPEQLMEFAANASKTKTKAKLTADIDMSGKTWTPLGEVVIEFDGQGHTISNLTYTTDGKSGAIGLFAGKITNNNGGSLVTNVTFKNCSLTVNNCGRSQVGIVAGYADRASATKITLDGVTLNVAQNAKEELCVGTVVGRSDWQYSGDYSYISGDIKSNTSVTVTSVADNDSVYVGGFVGATYGTIVSIKDSKMEATLSSPKTPRAYVHTVWSGAFEYYDTVSTTASLELHPNVQIRYGVTSPESYIAAVAKLNTNNNHGIVLGADLDFTGKDFPTITSNFVGVIDGQGHTIKNITLTKENVEGNVGIIANFLTNGGGNGTVRNLTVSDSTITVKVAKDKNAVVGIIGGHLNRGKCSNNHIVNTKFTVDGSVAGTVYVGGILGHSEWGNDTNDRVTIQDNTTDKNTVITGIGANTTVAGILGEHKWNNLNLQNCVNNATVKGDANVAGLVGHVEQNGSVINNCATYGNLIGKNVFGVVCTTNGVALTNVTVGGIITASEGVTDYGPEKASVGNGCSTAYISNPLSAETFASFLQTTPVVNGKASLRVLIVANEDHLATIDANAADISVTLKITATIDGVEKVGTVTKSLMELGLYKNVTANADVYSAAEGNCIFGLVVVDAPISDLISVELIVNNGETELHTGSVSFAE